MKRYQSNESELFFQAHFRFVCQQWGKLLGFFMLSGSELPTGISVTWPARVQFGNFHSYIVRKLFLSYRLRALLRYHDLYTPQAATIILSIPRCD